MTLHFTSGTSTAANASAYQVTGGEWASGEIQWSNKPAADTLLESNISHNNVTGYTFSCLTAVRHWYTGDTTGQNENYGIMLRYYDETTDDYNAVYSADYTDESKRPKLVISYEEATVSVLQGYTCSLMMPETTGTVIWSSDDTNVATISSTGVVTGVKAGKTTVTASVGETVYQTYTVYVTIQDGVYQIKYSNASLYLATSGGTAENTPVHLAEHATSGIAQVRQLWKIKYLGDGYYSIRPMHKLDMALHVTSNAVDIKTAGTTDTLAGVALADRWGIEQTEDSFYLKYVNTSSLCMKPADGMIYAGMSVVTANNSGLSSFKWDLELVTGMFLHDSNSEPADLPASIDVEVEMGGTYTQSQLGFTLTPSNLTVGWTTDNSAISVNSAGNLVAGERGIAAITASATDGSTQYTFQMTVTSIETIYVKNYYDSTYVGNTEKINNIYTAVEFLNLTYTDTFQLRFVMDGAPVQYADAGVDICPLGTEDCTTSCGESCLTHHKNIFRIALEMYNNYFERNHVVVMWSDSPEETFCVSNSTAHSVNEDALAATIWVDGEPLPVVQVLRNEEASDNGEVSMAINLAHEVAHTLGLKEIYFNEYGDDEPVGENNTVHSVYDDDYRCIMKYYNGYYPPALYYEVLGGDESALCNYCIEKLKTEVPLDAYES